MDRAAAEVLNSEDSVIALISGAAPLKSDADAQLLFNIPFMNEVQLKTISISAPSDGMVEDSMKMIFQVLGPKR